MKKTTTFKNWMSSLSFFFIFLASLVTTNSSAVTYQVGSGTATNSLRPIYTCYGYNYMQYIYTAAELNTAGASGSQVISQIRFFYATAASTPANYNNWTVYIGNTSQSSFTSTTNWVGLGSMTQAFSGTVTFPAAGNWMTINLSTPFTWNGTSNLVVAIDENSPGYSCTAAWRSYTATASRSIGYYSDGTNPNPASPPTANMAPATTMPQIQFEMNSANNCTASTPGSISGPTSVCVGSTVNLSLTGQALGSGINYQWQSKPTSSSTWTNIGTNSAAYSGTISAPTDFRCSVTCTFGGGTLFTPVYTVGINSFTNCYCSSNATSTADEEILGVAIGGMNNPSTCGQLGGTGSIASQYANYKGITPGNITQGANETISLTLGYCNGSAYSASAAVFIDYNQDGVFNATTERVYNSPYQAYAVGGSVVNGTFTVPTTALLGNTGMRIVYVESNSSPSPCGTYTWGETEDYLINIQAPQPMVLTSITTQQQTGVIGAGTIGAVIRINFATSGVLNPLTINNFGVTTSNTTDVSDILSARMYSTGSSGVFSTANQFGSSVFSPSGGFQFDGSQTLSNGNNYFFLAYEIAPWVTACNNVVDATVDYVTINNAPNAVAANSPVGVTPITPPITVSNLSPANNFVSSCRNVVLSWSAVAPYSAYDVYVDGSLFAYNITSGSQNVAIAGTHTWEVVPSGTAPLGCNARTFTAGTPLCYCVPAVSYGCGDNDIIARVSVNTLDNNSGTGCPSDPVPGNQGIGVNGNGYSDYTSNPALTTTLMQGYTYPVTVYVGQWSENFAVWVDGNDDGDFSPSERVGYTTTAPSGSGTAGVLGGSATFPITLDCNSPIGTHRMRIRCVYGTAGINITPCGSATYGETEDYNITYALGPVTEAVAAVVTGPTDAICNSSLTYTASDYVGSLQWQYSLDLDTWTDIANATNTTQGLIPSGPATYALRVRSRGIGCTPDAFSEPFIVNVVSPTVTIDQPVVSICRGTSTTLTATSDYPNPTYTWSNGATGASIVVSPLTETTYTVTVGGGLCTATASATVSVSGPTATTSNTPNTTGCPGTTHVLTGNLITGIPAGGDYNVTNVPFSTQTGVGTTGPNGDDVVSSAIALPFPFTFYGNTYNNVYISTNGFITFDAGSGSGCCSGQSLPSTTTPNNVIALCWDDLNAGLGQITYYSTGSSFVVDFNGVPHYGGSGTPVTGQIVLNADGSIQINSVNCVSDGSNHTQGVENSGGTLATTTPGSNGSTTMSLVNQSYLFTPPSAIPFTFDGPVTYTWSTGETTASINVAPDVTTTYSLTVADNSCSSTSTVTVNVHTPPTVTASNDGPICNGATVNLTANGSSTNGVTYIFRLTDSYGDGWNGARMEVRQGGTVVATLGSTFTTGSSQDVPVTLSPNTSYDLVYTLGGSWVSEVGIQVINNFNTNILTVGAGTGVVGSILHTWTTSSSLAYTWDGGISTTTAGNTATPSTNTTYSVTVTDNNGCTATSSTSVEVFYPSIICPADITVNSDLGMCGATIDIGTPTVSSLPCIVSVTNDHQYVQMSQTMEYPVGTTVVTWTVTDAYGNVASCTQNVTVIDTEAPRIEDVHANSIIDCPAVPEFSNPTVSDNCTVTVSHTDVVTPGCGNTYTTTRTWTAVDPSGNTTTASETITTQDVTAPSIVCNPTVYLCYEESNPVLTDPATSDACNNVSVVNNSNGVYPVGTTTVTWTATDACGNTSSCTQDVVRNSQINANFSIQAVPGYCQGGNVVITIIDVTGGIGDYTYLWSNGATTATVTVPNNATYTCTVTDNFSSVGAQFNCSRTFIYTANLDNTTLLSNYTIIGTNDVHIHGYQTILNGGVGATSNVATGSGCSGGRIKLHRNSVANSSTTFLKAKCIEVDATSTVTNQISGTPANPPMPVFDAGIVVPTSAPNVTVASNTSVTLSGTVYGNIMVKAGGKLTFLHASIDCKKLQVMQGATLRGDKTCTRVRVEGQFHVMKGAIINPAEDNHDFAIYVDNTNTSGSGSGVGSGGSGTSANTSVLIQQSAKVKAFIYVPNGGMTVKGPGGNGTAASGSGSGVQSVAPATSMTGLFIARDVKAHGRTTWNWNTTCMTCNYTLRDGEISENAAETLKNEDLKAGKIVQNFPDPFNSKTNIRFVMDKDTRAEVTVYDLTGKLVKTVYKGEVKSNQEYIFEFEGSSLPNGMYLYKVVTPESEHVGKMLLIKE